jgi:hypothetical protein
MFAKELSMTSLRQRMIEDMRVRNLAVGTQAIYLRHVSQFARHFGKSPAALGREQIRSFQVYPHPGKEAGSQYHHRGRIRYSFSLQSHTP